MGRMAVALLCALALHWSEALPHGLGMEAPPLDPWDDLEEADRIADMMYENLLQTGAQGKTRVGDCTKGFRDYSMNLVEVESGVEEINNTTNTTNTNTITPSNEDESSGSVPFTGIQITIEVGVSSPPTDLELEALRDEIAAELSINKSQVHITVQTGSGNAAHNGLLQSAFNLKFTMTDLASDAAAAAAGDTITGGSGADSAVAVTNLFTKAGVTSVAVQSVETPVLEHVAPPASTPTPTPFVDPHLWISQFVPAAGALGSENYAAYCKAACDEGLSDPINFAPCDDYSSCYKLCKYRTHANCKHTGLFEGSTCNACFYKEFPYDQPELRAEKPCRAPAYCTSFRGTFDCAAKFGGKVAADKGSGGGFILNNLIECVDYDCTREECCETTCDQEGHQPEPGRCLCKDGYGTDKYNLEGGPYPPINATTGTAPGGDRQYPIWDSKVYPMKRDVYIKSYFPGICQGKANDWREIEDTETGGVKTYASLTTWANGATTDFLDVQDCMDLCSYLPGCESFSWKTDRQGDWQIGFGPCTGSSLWGSGSYSMPIGPTTFAICKATCEGEPTCSGFTFGSTEINPSGASAPLAKSCDLHTGGDPVGSLAALDTSVEKTCYTKPKVGVYFCYPFGPGSMSETDCDPDSFYHDYDHYYLQGSIGVGTGWENCTDRQLTCNGDGQIPSPGNCTCADGYAGTPTFNHVTNAWDNTACHYVECNTDAWADGTDPFNNQSTNHFTADCSLAGDHLDECVITYDPGYKDGKVLCDTWTSGDGAAHIATYEGTYYVTPAVDASETCDGPGAIAGNGTCVCDGGNFFGTPVWDAKENTLNDRNNTWGSHADAVRTKPDGTTYSSTGSQWLHPLCFETTCKPMTDAEFNEAGCVVENVMTDGRGSSTVAELGTIAPFQPGYSECNITCEGDGAANPCPMDQYGDPIDTDNCGSFTISVRETFCDPKGYQEWFDLGCEMTGDYNGVTRGELGTVAGRQGVMDATNPISGYQSCIIQGCPGPEVNDTEFIFTAVENECHLSTVGPTGTPTAADWADLGCVLTGDVTATTMSGLGNASAAPGWISCKVACVNHNDPFTLVTEAPACPVNSTGANVPAGCTCQSGFEGTIGPLAGEPYWEMTACPDSSPNCNGCVPIQCEPISMGTSYAGNNSLISSQFQGPTPMTDVAKTVSTGSGNINFGEYVGCSDGQVLDAVVVGSTYEAMMHSVCSVQCVEGKYNANGIVSGVAGSDSVGFYYCDAATVSPLVQAARVATLSDIDCQPCTDQTGCAVSASYCHPDFINSATNARDLLFCNTPATGYINTVALGAPVDGVATECQFPTGCDVFATLDGSSLFCSASAGFENYYSCLVPSNDYFLDPQGLYGGAADIPVACGANVCRNHTKADGTVYDVYGGASGIWADQCGTNGVNSFKGYGYDATHCSAGDYAGMLWTSTCSAYAGGESGYKSQNIYPSQSTASIFSSAFTVNPKTGSAWSFEDTGCMPCKIEDWTWSASGPDGSCGMSENQTKACREGLAVGNQSFCDACYLHAIDMGWDSCDAAYDDVGGDWFRNLDQCGAENSGCVTCDSSYCVVGQYYDSDLCMEEDSGCRTCSNPLESSGATTSMPSYVCGADEYISGGCTGNDVSDSVGFCAPCDIRGGSSKHGIGTCSGTNMYIADRCTGAASDTQTQAKCVSCGDCGAGNYRSVPCAGGDNIMQCTECSVTGGATGEQVGGTTFFCGLGYFRSGAACDGTSDTDTQTCSLCTSGVGFVKQCLESAVCDGYGTRDTQDESALTTCTPTSSTAAQFTQSKETNVQATIHKHSLH